MLSQHQFLHKQQMRLIFRRLVSNSYSIIPDIVFELLFYNLQLWNNTDTSTTSSFNNSAEPKSVFGGAAVFKPAGELLYNKYYKPLLIDGAGVANLAYLWFILFTHLL